jgi:hypothetical protein
MKNFKYIVLLFLISAFSACEVDYLSNPNEAEIAPTYGIMNRAQKNFMDATRDVWFSGRMSLVWVQYWSQTAYTEEDRFQYRETTNQGGWNDIYLTAQDLISIIELNTDEATKGDMAKFGPNENQIAAAQIMLVYVYLHAVELWGDVPYYSFGSTNESFQANSLKDGVDSPVYAKQEDIYADMLATLKSAAAAIDVTAKMIDGDNFYGGDAAKWKLLANSLRLRIANRIKGVYPAATTHISEAIAGGVFTSNADNAGVNYENTALNAAPMYQAFYVDNRTDFAPSMQFVELLKGADTDFYTNPFAADPRLDIFIADNANGNKVGLPLTESNSVVGAFEDESFPGAAILAADYTEIVMEYAEVCFIQSELNGWDQTWYEAGVEASLERWGVDAADITAYIATLPAASEETVLTQKYIALYMQPMEAWSEYRRTGFPKSLVKPNVEYTYTWPSGSGTYTFKPIGGLTDLPTRNKYLLNEASINKANLDAAISSIGGDTQSTKLWWDKN